MKIQAGNGLQVDNVTAPYADKGIGDEAMVDFIVLILISDVSIRISKVYKLEHVSFAVI